MKIGDRVRDKITGFVGIDEPQLEIIENGVEDKSEPAHGGIRGHPKRRA